MREPEPAAAAAAAPDLPPWAQAWAQAWNGFPFPIASGAFRFTLGLRFVAEAEWLLAGPDVPAQLQERRRLLTARPEAVVACREPAGAAVEELWGLLAERLPAPTRLPALEPQRGLTLLERIGEHVAEDFCVLAGSAPGSGDGEGGHPAADGAYPLLAAVLCFPNRWVLSEKLGQSLAAIHGPVPGYRDDLASPVERFLDRLEAGRIALRYNWSVHSDPALFQSVARRTSPNTPAQSTSAQSTSAQSTSAQSTSEGDPEHSPACSPDWERGEASAAGDSGFFLRVERQTFRRLPQSGAIVFGIRTLIAPLAPLVTVGERHLALNQALATMPEAVVQYKGMVEELPLIRAWLERLA